MDYGWVSYYGEAPNVADTPISALPAAGAAALANELEINEAGTSKKVTVQKLLDGVNVLGAPGAGLLADADKINVIQSAVAKGVPLSKLREYVGWNIRNASVTAQGAGFASDTYLVGSSVQIPTTMRARAQTTYRCAFDASKTAAGVATPIITFRFGTAGAIGDAARCTLTFPAQTAAIDNALFEVIIVFRTVGTGTSAVCSGRGTLSHGASITGFSTSVSPTALNTGGGFDSDVNLSFCGISVNGGTSAAWTVQVVESSLRGI
jgi:hypothetical protein